ncbi:MAG: hypothetical protein NC301_01500 [Bacteroides sp.]|nr:hypothetical protein [Bacteroides sp.]MCM1378558.1 hypothetical protein [Bacteroides sp.]MCM1444859.1 hypothetical protein [Prevotella sp.]
MSEDFIHKNNRRKFGHDYSAPWKYHLTIGKASAAPDFSQLKVGSLLPDGVDVELLELGKLIQQAIYALPEFEPRIKVYQYIIMPDHVHLLINVVEPLERPIGNFIGGFKTGIAKKWRAKINNPDAQIFTEGFNDQIIYTSRNLDDIFRYIRQNPYRLAIRRLKPEFFSRARNIFIGEREHQAYGNLFLLRNPFKELLVVHRSDSAQDFENKRERCLYAAANGGVVVSAFISPREKMIRREIEEIGGRMIVVHNRPFKDRQKPALHDFELCADGRLLLVSALDSLQLKNSDQLTRQQCLDMNAMAAEIAANRIR